MNITKRHEWCVIHLTLPNNNNRLKTSVLNTVLNTVRIVKSFSVKPEKCNTLIKAMEIFKREQVDFSSGVLWALSEFVERHSYNPQPTLDRLMNLEMPNKPRTVCFVPDCRAKSRYAIVLRDFKGAEETFHVCSRHKKWKHKQFRFLIRSRELRM